MKIETGTFSASSNSVVILLEDEDMVVRGVTFIVGYDGASSTGGMLGFTDGVRNRSNQSVTSTISKRSTTYCVQYYKNVSGSASRKLEGRASYDGLSPEPGQIALWFDYYDPSISIDFMAIGE